VKEFDSSANSPTLSKIEKDFDDTMPSIETVRRNEISITNVPKQQHIRKKSAPFLLNIVKSKTMPSLSKSETKKRSPRKMEFSESFY